MKEDRTKLGQSNTDSGELSLALQLLHIFARQINLIIMIPILFCLLTIVYLIFFTSPVFESSVKITLQKQSSNNTGNYLARQFGISLESSEGKDKLLLPEIVKSKTLARAMLKRKFNVPGNKDKVTLFKILTGNRNIKTEDIPYYEMASIQKFQSMLYFKKNGQFYDLKVESSDPVLAKEILSSFLDELNIYRKNKKMEQASETKTFIMNRLVQTEKELVAAEEQLKVFRERNRRIENSPHLQIQEQRLLRETAVITGVFTTLKQQLETAKIEEVKDSDKLLVVDPPEIPFYKTKPNRKFLTIISGILGIGFAFLFAILKDNFESSKYMNNELAAVYNIIRHNLMNLFRKKIKKI